MKRFISIPIILLLFVSCSGGDKEKNSEKQKTANAKELKIKNDWIRHNLKSRVKSVNDAYYHAMKKVRFKKMKKRIAPL